jgi:hypothetical protein
MSVMAESSPKPLIVLPGPKSNAPGETGVERRAEIRFPITASADVFDTQSGARLRGRTSDLSISRCYIDTQSPFPKDTTVRLCLEYEKQKMEALAIVVYALIPMGMGISFIEIRPGQLEILRSWMPKSPGEPSREQGAAAPASGGETQGEVSTPRLVLYELIYLMIRKKLITENEGAGLLKQLFH